MAVVTEPEVGAREALKLAFEDFMPLMTGGVTARPELTEYAARLRERPALGRVFAKDAELVAGFEEMAKRFQAGTKQKTSGPAARSQTGAPDA